MTIARKISEAFESFLFRPSPTDDVSVYIAGHRIPWKPGLPVPITSLTTAVIVPTTTQVFPVTLTERTKDGQSLSIQCEIAVTYDVKTISSRRNFMFDLVRQAYTTDDPNKIGTDATSLVRNAVRATVATWDLAEASNKASELEEAVSNAIGDGSNDARDLGLAVERFSVTRLTPSNNDLVRALEAKVREQLLQEEGTALAARRRADADNAHELRMKELEHDKTEAATELAVVEAKKAAETARANLDAEVEKLRLEGYKGLDPMQLVAIALLKLGSGGTLTSLSLTPDLETALKKGLGSHASG